VEKTRLPRGPRSGFLEIEEDLSFQRRMWVVQRIGWLAMCLVLLLAGVGLLGPSRLTRNVLRQSGTELEYYRVGRLNSPQEIRLLLSEPGSEHRLRVDRVLASALSIERIEPEPAEASGDAATLFLTFAADAPLQVILHCRPARIGSVRGTLRVGDGPAFHLAQFVLP